MAWPIYSFVRCSLLGRLFFLAVLEKKQTGGERAVKDMEFSGVGTDWINRSGFSQGLIKNNAEFPGLIKKSWGISRGSWFYALKFHRGCNLIL